MSNWESCKNILCILPDNVGDLIMTGPAMRVLKESFGAKITVLTSSMAGDIAKDMPEVDEVMIFDLPWTKVNEITPDINLVMEKLKRRQFDAAVIFTRYNQNSLPAAMLAYMAGIPKRLAYCREDPYQLLTDWLPDKEPERISDKEPYSFVKHQVKRDLDLIATVNATTGCERFILQKKEELWPVVKNKLASIGVDTSRKWMLLHAGVSEIKREYPVDKWIEAGKKIIDEFDCQVIFTGSLDEKPLIDYLRDNVGAGSFSAAGLFSLREFILLIDKSPLVISVNTGTIHIAAAVSTPVIVLYGLADPQHIPWRSPCKVLRFEIPQNLQSKNELIRFVKHPQFDKNVKMPSADDILKAAHDLLKYTSPDFIETKLKHTA